MKEMNKMAKKRINGSKNKTTDVNRETLENTIPVPEKTYSEGMQQGFMYGCILGAVIMYLI